MNPIKKFIIKDKFDNKTADQIIDLGYPANKEYLVDFLFWSCFPNDPVCISTYPYIESLSDEILSIHIPEFLEFNLSVKQMDMISECFFHFINPKGQSFRDKVIENSKTLIVKQLFTMQKYSLESYNLFCDNYESQ